mmetsp:Transcript_99440/g.176395  ORF Transcript_99440/g.176395 Transcript_99440/m.176395 type:complete len:427 (+) Transcript_99440:62-1342(+)
MSSQLLHGCTGWVKHHASRPFKCFTLNTLASPVPHNRMEGERLACLLQHICEQQYDVVAFQELMKRHFYDRQHLARYEGFVEELRAMGFVHDIRGPRPESTFKPLDGGTAIFSKHPFVRCSEHHWQQQASWDALASKGILHALIDIMPPLDGLPLEDAPILLPVRLHVFTLHAQASHHGWQNTSGAEKYRKVRLRQMQQLTQVIKREAADGEPVLVLGDFNFDARQPSELRRHQAEFGQDTGRSSPPLDVVATSFDGNYPATYAWKTKDNKLAEPFLTTSQTPVFDQSIDHVYYWPKETAHAPRMQDTSCFMKGHLGSISEPRCRLEHCPYTGPANSHGKMPSHVSDHCGWSVDMDLTWSDSACVEWATTSIPAVADCALSALQVEKNCKNSNEDPIARPIARRVAYWLGSCFLVPTMAFYTSATN